MSFENIIMHKLNNIELLLKNQSDEILNFKQACIFLDLTPSYLYKLTSTLKIPCYKPHGKRLYFSKSELSEWLKQNPLKLKK